MNVCLSLLKEDEGQVMKASGSRLLSEHPAIFLSQFSNCGIVLFI